MKTLLPPFAASSPAEHNTRPTYRRDIDGLRAVAILCVIATHAFPTLLRGGFVGVDIFFVISGFLISSIIFRSLEKDEFSFAEFYAHRVRRIFPALILVLVACFAFGWFALLPDEYAQLGKHIAAGAGFAQNLVLWKEAGYFDVTSELKPLTHLWSLAVEEQFYLLYPLLIWLAWRAGLNVLTIVLALLLLSFGLNAYGINKDAVKTFYLLQTRFWELLAGAVLAHGAIHWKALKPRLLDIVFHPVFFRQAPEAERREAVFSNMVAVLGALLVLVSVTVIHRERAFPGAWALLPVAAASLLILAGPGAWVNRNLLGNRVMVWVGLISYPLYLWHWPLLSFARIMESGAPSRRVRIAAVALSFVLAWLTWRLIERPIRFNKRTWVTSAALTAVLAIVGYVGYNDFHRDGLAFRSGVRNFLAFGKQFEWNSSLNATEECRQRFIPGFPGRGYCLVSGPQAPSVMLIGDSHANHLYPGLAKELAGTGETLLNLGEGGCPPLFDVESQKRGEAKPHGCSDLVNKMLEIVEQTPSAKTIVISDIGAHFVYWTQKGYGLPEEGPNKWVLTRRGQPDTGNNGQIYEAALRETLGRLSAKGKRIILVLDNADVGFSPKSCIASRPIRLSGTVRSPCAVPREETDRRKKTYRALVARVTKDMPNVQVFDAALKFCDDKWCWAIKDGTLMYRDSSHLSVAGSEYIGHFLAPIVLQSLADARRQQ